MQVNPRSEQMVAKMKARLFRELFEQLDIAGVGRVNLEEALQAPAMDPQLRLDLTDAVALVGGAALDLDTFQVGRPVDFRHPRFPSLRRSRTAAGTP